MVNATHRWTTNDGKTEDSERGRDRDRKRETERAKRTSPYARTRIEDTHKCIGSERWVKVRPMGRCSWLAFTKQVLRVTKCKVQLLIICQPSGSKENRGGGIVSSVCRPHLTPHLPLTSLIVSIWLLKATTYAITGGAAEGGRLKAETKGSAATTTPYTTQQHTYLDRPPRGHNNNGISDKTNQQTNNKQNLKNDVRNATRTDSNVERRIVKEILIIRMKETCQPTLQTNDEYNRCHPGPL